MICTHCGHRIPDGYRFCDACGKPVTTPDINTPQQKAIPVVFDEPAPTPTEHSVEVPMEAPVASPKRKKWVLPLSIGILVLVLTAAAAAFLLFGKQTVYLMTKSVTTNIYTSNTHRYDYDEEGRLTKLKYQVAYTGSSNYSYQYEIAYSYNDEGNIKTATFKAEEETIKIEYVYKKGVLSDLKIKSSDFDGDIEVDCSKKGFIESIELIDEDGDSIGAFSFKYYENGTIKKSTLKNGLQKTVSQFNEAGKVTEATTYYNNEQRIRYVYDYDKDGNMILQETYDADDQLQTRLKMEYTFKKQRLDTLKMRIEGPSNDDKDKIVGVNLLFESEWDGLEGTMTITDIDGDKEFIENLEDQEYDLEDLELLLEYDENGNLCAYELYLDGEIGMSAQYSYEAYKLPRRYQQPNPQNDPLYLYFLLGT
jgi:uncharacterized protein YuzE